MNRVYNAMGALSDPSTEMQWYTEPGLRCYERVHMGVEEYAWREQGDARFWKIFRDVALTFAGCLPKEADALFWRTPRVVLVQRDDFQGNVMAYGDRVFRNLPLLEAILWRLQDESVIRYRGYDMFFPNMTVETQACRVADADILIAAHGNAQALAVYMAAGSVLIEYGFGATYYRELAASLHMHYILRTEIMSMPSPPQFEKTVREAVKLWR